MDDRLVNPRTLFAQLSTRLLTKYSTVTMYSHTNTINRQERSNISQTYRQSMLAYIHTNRGNMDEYAPRAPHKYLH
jgi:hypothetical protein